MKKFLIFYRVENDEEFFEHEHIVKADDIEEAIKFFKIRVRTRKKEITTITELPYGE